MAEQENRHVRIFLPRNVGQLFHVFDKAVGTVVAEKAEFVFIGDGRAVA